MLLLIVVLAVLAAVRLIVILLIRESGLRRGNSGEDPFFALRMDQAFDPDHAIIWDTQLPALELMASAGGDGAPVKDLRGFYARSCGQYPELYDGSSFRGWLEFLKREQLVDVDGDRASLSNQGLHFLRARCKEAFTQHPGQNEG